MEHRSLQALRAAVAVAADHGLPTADPVVLADGMSLVAHLRPAPIVARVPTGLARVRRDVEHSLEREIAVSHHLDRAGIPVQVPSPELPPGPHHRDGHHVTFWTLIDVDGSQDVTVDDCAAMLPALHESLSGYAGELPVLGPAVTDIPLGMAGLIGLRNLLDDAEIAAVRERAADLVPAAEDPDGPWVGLHGNLHPGALLRAAHGPVWTGLTDVCRGPAEWDMAMLGWLDRWSGTTSVADRLDPDSERMRVYSDLRAVHVISSLVLFPGTYGDAAAYAAHLRSMVDLLLGRTPG